MSLTTTQSGLKRIETRWGHRYTLDGEDCPGVTTLIGKAVPKSFGAWGAGVVAGHIHDMDADELDRFRRAPRELMVKRLKGEPNRVRDAAAKRGTTVHGYMERLVRGEPTHVQEPELNGYVQAGVDFLNDWRPAPVLAEASVASRTHWYCGTVDLICDLPDGRRALMDYKTSATGIYPDVALQLAAYRYADFTVNAEGHEVLMSALAIDCTYVVWIKDGSYEVKPISTGRDVFDAFLSVSTTARYLELAKTWVGDTETWKAAA